MPSSTFASETRFARSATAAFVCVLLALLAPYEALVRAAEHRWGMLPARITPRRTGAPHIEMFLEDRAAGIVYPVVAVGTSRVENGVRPDAINALIGPTYNLGIGGGSSIVTLEFLESLNIVPRHLIVGLSPMDFTPLALVRGRKVIARRHVEQPG